ncbi:MAG TPA: class I SAM-dependent methyltransferase [Candidatus Eisenbacteria bacterium]|nr:class I SAM-dependent methyltransferase [Candidatus Eisenbacteria bacterium]
MIRYQGISTLEILEEAKNYNNWIAEQFLPLIRTPLLEIGAGTGNISKHFVNKKNVTITDIDAGLVKQLKKKFSNSTVSDIRTLNVLGKIKKGDIGKYKTIIAINVLEHIQDDAKALANMYRMLKKGGKLLLLIPAKKIAYTRLDNNLGHFRRYEKDELSKKLKASGFTLETLYFFNIVGLFSWIVRDKIESSHQMKPYQVILFDKIVPVLKIIERYIKMPVGISLILTATKK